MSFYEEEIKKLVSISEINALIGEFLQKDDFFCIEAKYYKDVIENSENYMKRVRIIGDFGHSKKCKLEIFDKSRQPFRAVCLFL